MLWNKEEVGLACV